MQVRCGYAVHRLSTLLRLFSRIDPAQEPTQPASPVPPCLLARCRWLGVRWSVQGTVVMRAPLSPCKMILAHCCPHARANWKRSIPKRCRSPVPCCLLLKCRRGGSPMCLLETCLCLRARSCVSVPHSCPLGPLGMLLSWVSHGECVHTSRLCVLGQL